MNIIFSKDLGKVDFSVNDNTADEDIKNCAAIERLTQTEEWKTFLVILLQMHERFLDATTSVKPQEQSFREVGIYAARLGGLTQAMQAADKIVKAYKEYKVEKVKEVHENLGRTYFNQPEENLDLAANE